MSWISMMIDSYLNLFCIFQKLPGSTEPPSLFLWMDR